MPTIITLIPDKNGKNALLDYLLKYDFLKYPEQNFHSTILYSPNMHVSPEKKIKDEIFKFLPIFLNPSTYFLDLFGDLRNELVLRYENDDIRKIHEFLSHKNNYLNKKDISCYPEFNPHITLAKRVREDELKQLDIFKEVLVLNDLFWKV